MKKQLFYAGWLLALAAGSFCVWRFSAPSAPAQKQAALPAATTASETMVALLNEPLLPLPAMPDLDPRKVALGRRLFHDPRLSKNNTISCASCHNIQTMAGADGRKLSLGIEGALGKVNAPTVFNSGLNFKQFWDGRAATLEEQVHGPVTNSLEMGAQWPDVIAKLGQDADYVTEFKTSYGEGSITPDMITDAIAVFERSLVTPSRFDRYLLGDKTALTQREQEGYRLFKEHGCVACHQGVSIGGNMFQTMGKMADYFGDRGNITESDMGRFNVTKDDRDKYKFKVPGLRNVALTPPYFHDGNAATLEEAIQTMAKYQLGAAFTDEEVGLIIEFLKSLNGEYDGKPLEKSSE